MSHPDAKPENVKVCALIGVQQNGWRPLAKLLSKNRSTDISHVFDAAPEAQLVLAVDQSCR